MTWQMINKAKHSIATLLAQIYNIIVLESVLILQLNNFLFFQELESFLWLWVELRGVLHPKMLLHADQC